MWNLETLTAGWLRGFGSPNTREAYERDIRAYYEFCARENVDPLDAIRVVIDEYRNWLLSPDPNRKRQRKAYSPASAARKLAAVSSFYDYCVGEADWLVPENPCTRVRRPKYPSASQTRGLTLDEVKQLRRAAREAGGTDGLLVLVLLATGMRVSEGCHLETSDLSVDKGHRVVRVIRKGGEPEWLPLPASLAAELDRYIGDRTGPVFLLHGQQVDRRRARTCLNRVARRCGLEGRVHPHILRHAAATLLLEAGEPVSKVQRMLGHSDVRTTMAYNDAKDSAATSSVHRLEALLAEDDE